MIGFSAPWWLLALSAAPLVYWLHRYSAPLERREVSAIFLWRAAPVSEGGGRRRQPPDPAWRRCALIVVLAALALAQPWWRSGYQPVTVWIDDSLSMRAVENGRPRLAAGLAELRRALAATGIDSAVLRSLGDPAVSRRSTEVSALAATSWLRGEPRAIRPPPPALLSPRSAHWLLTDGASEPLRRWAGAAPLARIITVGAASENVAVTRLAARRNVADPHAFDLAVEVSNRGRRAATRELELRAGAFALQHLTLELPAGETRRIAARHRIGGVELSASLSPGDALVEDDALSLNAAAFTSLPVLADPRCPAPLQRAIAAHPALSVARDGDVPALQLSCTGGEMRAAALLRIHGGPAQPITVPPAWLPVAAGLEGTRLPAAALARVDLPPVWLAAVEHDLHLADFQALLVAGERPLVVRRNGQPAQVHVLIDMARPEFVEQPEYAVFVSGLAEAALGRQLLDNVSMVARPPEESDIEPAAPLAAAAEAPPRQSIRRSGTNLLLALALIVGLLDLVLLFRREATRDA